MNERNKSLKAPKRKNTRITVPFFVSLQEDVPDVPGPSVRAGPSVRLHAHDGLRCTRGRQEIQIQVSTLCVCVCVCVWSVCLSVCRLSGIPWIHHNR